MKLKYKWHSYSDDHEYEIEVPDDIKFVHVNGDVGKILHKGYGHYLGCSRDTIQEDKYKSQFGCRVYKDFTGLVLFAFDNVIFENDITLEDNNKFTKEFELDDYYVIVRTKQQFKVHDIGKNNIEVIIDGDYDIISSRIVSISKILNVRSQHLIDVMQVTLSSWMDFDDSEAKAIILNRCCELNAMLNDYFNDVEVKKGCDTEFADAINQVLGLVNKTSIDSEIEHLYELKTKKL